MHSVAVPVLGIIINILLQCVEANLTLDFKVTKISASHKSANCNVANTTYAHGETFKLDCKTQCVCENGRHACSSLCPKEQLPAPEDTISCRSPRLVEVPGHCCKMWLCENPTADVYATCHNTSTSPWTPCSHRCGLGISTRFTTTTAGCNQLSNLRLCENRKCDAQQQDNSSTQTHVLLRPVDRETKQKQKYLMKTKQLKLNKLKRSSHQHQKHYLNNNNNNNKQLQPVIQEHLEYEHRIRKGHECRSLQRLGPARVRLGECVSKKLYRPKICGHCHQNAKCCVPSVSTTIQVELLCPLNAVDPISFVQQQLNAEQQQQQGQDFYTKTTTTTSSPSTSSTSLTSLWDTHSLDAIDQEYLQSHQIQIANKFIAVEWILKCECTKTDNCQRIVNTTAATRADSSSGSRDKNRDGVGNSNNINNHKHHDYDDNENIDISNSGHNRNMQNFNYFKLNHKNSNSNKNSYSPSKWKHAMLFEDYKQAAAAADVIQIDKIPDDSKNVDKHVEKKIVNDYENGMDNENEYEYENDADNDSEININKNYNNGKRNTNRHNRNHSHRFNHKKQIKDYDDEINNNNKDNSNGNVKYKNSIKMINSQDYVGEEQNDEEQEMYNEEVEKKKWPAVASASSSSSSSSADEIQPDIIPYPPPPFSANKHTNNNNYNNNYNNNNKNSQANWIKEKLQLEQQQQEFNEHWLLQQYSNNKPYQKVNLAT